MNPPRPVHHVRLRNALCALALASISLAPAADNWTGTIRSEINITAAGYSHQETQTWTLAGTPPSTQGSSKMYAATWAVTGQGWHDRTNASSSRRIASWTAGVSGRSAPVSFLITPSGELFVQVGHSQLTAPKGYTGTDQVIQNGVPFSSQRLEMTIYEWPFQRIQALPTDTQLTGTHTSQPVAFLGPLQPQGAQVTVTCVWALGQGSAPPLPPSTLPPPTTPPGASPPAPADRPGFPPGGRTGGTIERPPGEGATISPVPPAPATPPRDPTNFTATQTGAGQVELRWDVVPGVVLYSIVGAGLPEGRKVNATSTTITGLPAGTHEWLATSWYDPDGSRTNANQWPRASVTIRSSSGRYRVTATRLKIHHEEPDNRFKQHGRNNEIFITEHTQVIDRRTGTQRMYDDLVPHPGVASIVHSSPIHGDTNNADHRAFHYRIRAGSVASSGGMQTGDEIQLWDADQMLHRNLTANPGGPTEGLASHPSPGIFTPADYQPFVVWEGELNDGIEVALIRPVVWLAINTWGGGSTDQFVAPYVSRVMGPDRTRDFLTMPAIRDALSRDPVMIAKPAELVTSGQWLVDRHRPFGLEVNGTRNGAPATWTDVVVLLTREKAETFLAGRNSGELEVRIRGSMRGQNPTAMGDCSLFLKIERGPDGSASPPAVDASGPVDIVPPFRSGEQPASRMPPSPPQSPAVLPPPPPAGTAPTSGTYRIILNGFRVNRRTFEGVENDGSGDEVYAAAQVYVGTRNPPTGTASDKLTLSIKSESVVKTAVHGNIEAGTGRVRAGSAREFGGLHNGDVFPTGQDPATLRTAPIPRTFPLLVWEGELADGKDVVVIKPALWEADGDTCVYSEWEDDALWFGNKGDEPIYEKIRTADLTPFADGAWPFFCFNYYFLLGKVYNPSECTCMPGKDRPIGLVRGDEQNAWWDGQTMVVTREAVEKALRTPPQPGGLPQGVIAMRFADTGLGQDGDYDLFVRIERVTATPPPPPPGSTPTADVARVRPPERTVAPEPPTADVTPIRPPERTVAPEPPATGNTLLRLTPPTAHQGEQGVVIMFDTAPSQYFSPNGTADFGPGIALRSFEFLTPISARAVIDVAADAAVGPRILTLRRALRPPDTFADVFTVTAAPMRGSMMDGGAGGREVIRDRPGPGYAGAPQNPELFSARQTGPSSVQLTWNAVPDAAAYVIFGPAAENGIKFTGTSAIVSGLDPGTYRWFVASWYDPDGVRTPVGSRPSTSITVTRSEDTYRVTAASVEFHKDESDNPGWGGDGRSNEIYVTSFAQVIDRRSGSEVAKGPLFRSPVHGDTNANPSGGVRVRAGSYTSSGGIRTGDVVNLRAHGSAGSETLCWIWSGVLRDGIDVLILRPVLWEFDGDEGPWLAPYTQRLQGEAPGAIYQNPTVAGWISQPNLFAGVAPQLRQSGPWTPDGEDHPIGLTQASTGGGGLVAGSDPDLTWFDRVIVVTREKLELLLQSGNGAAAVEVRLPGDGRDWIADCTLKLTFERGAPPSSSSSSSSEALIRDALKKLQPKIEPGQ